jgi:polar amino acid transport system ATP-binding protein
MVVVTHEIGFAREVAGRIAFMVGGAITVDAPPAAFFANDSDERLKSFLSKIL